jgi:hypothetical protein
VNDDGGLFFGILLCLVVYFLIPVQAAVHPQDWKQAEEICKLNGGIKTVERPDYSLLYLGQFQVDCNNGGIFYPRSTRYSANN